MKQQVISQPFDSNVLDAHLYATNFDRLCGHPERLRDFSLLIQRHGSSDQVLQFIDRLTTKKRRLLNHGPAPASTDGVTPELRTGIWVPEIDYIVECLLQPRVYVGVSFPPNGVTVKLPEGQVVTIRRLQINDFDRVTAFVDSAPCSRRAALRMLGNDSTRVKFPKWCEGQVPSAVILVAEDDHGNTVGFSTFFPDDAHRISLAYHVSPAFDHDVGLLPELVQKTLCFAAEECRTVEVRLRESWTYDQTVFRKLRFGGFPTSLVPIDQKNDQSGGDEQEFLYLADRRDLPKYYWKEKLDGAWVEHDPEMEAAQPEAQGLG